MKRLLWLLFLLFIPFVAANSPGPINTFNIYLDGQELELFDLKAAYCLTQENIIYPEMVFLEKGNDCSWYLQNYSICIQNPCSLMPTHLPTRFYLQPDDSTVILTEEFSTSKFGYYNVYISSDGQVDLKFLRDHDNHQGNLLSFIMILTIFNALVESFVAYLFFKKNKISYRNIWWVVGANIVTFTLFALFMDMIQSLWILLLVEVLIILIEALIYYRAIKELGWKGSFALSFQANLWTIATGILLSTAIFLIFSL